MEENKENAVQDEANPAPQPDAGSQKQDGSVQPTLHPKHVDEIMNEAALEDEKPGRKEEESPLPEHQREPEMSEKFAGEEKRKEFGIPYGLLSVFFGIMIISYIYFTYGKNAELLSLDKNVTYPMLFLFGLVTGLHCIGMCGSFLVAYTSKNAAEGRHDRLGHLKYGLGKTLSYTFMGGVFGLIGSVFAFTPEIRGGVGVLAGIFLIIYGLNMLNIFPALRKLQLRLPGLGMGEQMQNKGPFYMGLGNGLFLACGPLQAMYIYAAGTGSPVQGALSLLAFGLGTLPFMMLFGFSLSSLTKHLHKIIKFSGALVFVLGLAMANNGLNLLGVGVLGGGGAPSVGVDDSGGVQTITMAVDSSGYTPDNFVLRKGEKVRWVINVNELTGCNREIIVRDYGLDIKLHEGQNIVEFTPDKAGTVRWSCWMGMIPGSFTVV